MTPQHPICIFFSRAILSVLLYIGSTAAAQAQQKTFVVEKDSIPFFNGMQLSFDLVGPAMRAIGSTGEIEGALRFNLHDQYYPIVELGYGMANHENDDITGLTYKTQAPYFRFGCDINLLKNKHSANKFYGGVRYAFTYYNVDISRTDITDPVWGGNTSFAIDAASCNQHWIEVVFGIDAQVWGPLHLGWNVRYKRRLSHKDAPIGNTWYIPGYGKYGDTRVGANFNIIFDI